MRASEQQVNGLKHDLHVEKSTKMSIENSKAMCETQMNILDKKYNGEYYIVSFNKLKTNLLLHFVYSIYKIDLIVEHRDVLNQLKNMESAIYESRSEITDLKIARDDYKRKVSLLSEEHKRCEAREKQAYAKLVEALHMVDTAIADKNAALHREKELRGKQGVRQVK